MSLQAKASLHPQHADTAAHKSKPALSATGRVAPWSGNQSHLRKLPLQRKLAIGSIDDPLEREADHTADDVLRRSPAIATPQLSRAVGKDRRSPAPAIVHQELRSPGQPLAHATRSFMEARFGHDLSNVRIHDGNHAAASAKSIGARAYTVGNEIVFAAGEYAPASHAGRRLVAHELAHVVQQSGATSLLQRAPGKQMTKEEAEAWYNEINVDQNFSDPSGPSPDADPLSGQAREEALEESLQQSLTPEEIHRQLLVRRAQPLGATAYQAGNPGTLAQMRAKINQLTIKIKAGKENIKRLRRQGATAKPELDKVRTETGAFEDELRVLTRASKRFPKSAKFSQFGKGAAAGTGRITYAGIQIENAAGRRIAIEYAETTGTEHAEEALIRELEARFTPEQLRGARVTVVGDQVVCGERCVPALRRFAERNGIESIEGIVFQRAEILPAGFIGPPALASPRVTLRSMTKASSEGRELFQRVISIYRRAGAAVTGAEHSAESAIASTAEESVFAIIRRLVSAASSPGVWRTIAANFVKALKTLTPAKIARFGKNLAFGLIKGFIVAELVEFIIGDSRLEDDLAAFDQANHTPHNALPEKIRRFEKTAISFLPAEAAVFVAGTIHAINPLSADFLYEATVQDAKRGLEKFKEEYGDSDEGFLLYQQSLKAVDDFNNGLLNP
jgi:hypothetical protein